jgi:hypothetical protein
MFVYMQNLAARESRRRQVDGVILYAVASGSFRQDWSLFGHNLRIAGVDLSKDWMLIEENLLAVIGIESATPRHGAPT